MTSSPEVKSVEELVDEDAWVVLKRGLFYRPNASGYTGIRDHAGRYSYDEALAHEDHWSGVQIMPLLSAPEFSAECFDDLAVKHLKEQRDALRNDNAAKDQRIAAYEAALNGPRVWSEDERERLADAYRRADARRGLFETLFAVAKEAQHLASERARALLQDQGET